MSPRVLHVAQPTDAGVARCVAELSADQVRRGWVVAVACPPDGPLTRWSAAAGASVIPWRATRGPGAVTGGEALRLSAVVRRYDPDLTHLHSSKAGLAGRLALRGRRATLFQPHAWSFEAVTGAQRRAAVAWERASARWATRLICVSEHERRIGEAAGIRATWAVVPNGVDLDAYPPADDAGRAAARRLLGLGDGPVVVCVGRLGAQKGQDVLLGAWPAVRRSVPQAQLYLVGDGPARPALAAIDRPGVTLTGRRDDVRRWLAAADVVASPSRWEGMSLAVLEAAATGRSVVATDVAGSREILPPGTPLVPVGDGEALAAAITARLLDPQLAATEGAAARRHVERYHSLAASTTAMAELYEEVLARG